MWIMTLPLMEMNPIRLSDSHSPGDQKPRLVGWTKWQGNWDESRREEPGKGLDGSLESECFPVQRQGRLAVDQRCNHWLKGAPGHCPWTRSNNRLPARRVHRLERWTVGPTCRKRERFLLPGVGTLVLREWGPLGLCTHGWPVAISIQR